MNVESRGFDIRYQVAGSGPPMLLVHGLLQSSQRWIDCGYPEAFGSSHRLVMPDLLGHGQSDKPHDPAAYTTDGLVADLLAVLDAEGLERVGVWAYSAGAAPAASLASDHPQRVSSLIVGGMPPDVPADVRRAVSQPGLDALRAGDWETFWEQFHPVDEASKQPLQGANDPLAVAAFLEGLIDTAPEYPQPEMPALCYEGTDEPYFEFVEATARELGAAFVPLDGLGHQAAFQQVGAIAPAVRTFLDRVASGAGRG